MEGEGYQVAFVERVGYQVARTAGGDVEPPDGGAGGDVEPPDGGAGPTATPERHHPHSGE